MNLGAKHPAAADLAHRVPEMGLLLAAARTRPAASLAERLDRPIDWRRFLGLAESHHVVPLIHKTFGSIPSVAVPDPICQCLHEAFNGNARRVMFLMAELVRLIDLFSAEGIETVPFKGPILAQDAYGNLTLRQCGDLDLLIRPAHIPRASACFSIAATSCSFPTALRRSRRSSPRWTMQPSSAI